MTIRLLKPSPGVITSPYGPRRPGKVGSTNHKGIDFSWMRPDRVQDWTIYAAAAGTVTFVGYYGGWGNLTRISHGRGYETWYAHQSAFKVRKRQKVTAGQPIGVIGNTGTSSGSHLHFELRLFGVPINPAKKFTSTAGGNITPTPNPRRRSTDMATTYYTTADDKPNGKVLEWAKAGDSPGTPANWLPTRSQEVANGFASSTGGGSVFLGKASYAAFRAQYLAPVETTATVTIDYAKLAAALKGVSAGPSAAENAAEVIRQMKLPGN